MDIPKFYLLCSAPGSAFAYEAVDGQQRLRAIFDFADDQFQLRYTTALPPIDGIDVAGHSFSSLSDRLTKRFFKFKLGVAEITSADYDEVRQLFLRLQMGVALNPAELRNATGGPIRNVIDAMALTHQFFTDSRIAPGRYKHQDYLAHAFALADRDGNTDLKASNLRMLYDDYRPDQTDEVLDLMAKVGHALDVLTEMNRLAGHKITQKWIFVDLFWLIYLAQQNGVAINSNVLAEKYKDFEGRRRKNIRSPEILLDDSRSDALRWDKELYAYIQAFRASGANRQNLQIRHASLQTIFGNIGGE